MNEDKLKQAIAKFQSFVSHLPAGDTEEKYIDLYHSLLDDIQNETGKDLSYYLIPSSEIQHKAEGGHREDFGEWIQHYSSSRYCPRPLFLMNLQGAVNYLNSLTSSNERRPIGFY